MLQITAEFLTAIRADLVLPLLELGGASGCLAHDEVCEAEPLVQELLCFPGVMAGDGDSDLRDQRWQTPIGGRGIAGWNRIDRNLFDVGKDFTSYVQACHLLDFLLYGLRLHTVRRAQGHTDHQCGVGRHGFKTGRSQGRCVDHVVRQAFMILFEVHLGIGMETVRFNGQRFGEIVEVGQIQRHSANHELHGHMVLGHHGHEGFIRVVSIDPQGQGVLLSRGQGRT